MTLADLYSDHVPNGLIVLGIASGLFCSLWQNGAEGILQAFLSIGVSFFLMYPLFKIGGLGAGDVKMFLVTACFFTAKSMLTVIAGAFVIGAVMSVGKLLWERNGVERMQYFFSYMAGIFRTRRWSLYGEELRQDYYSYQKNKIHFTLPILLSVAIRLVW